eukprot:4035547-Prymnesium_polylepis.1
MKDFTNLLVGSQKQNPFVIPYTALSSFFTLPADLVAMACGTVTITQRDRRGRLGLGERRA